jgi:hypothetical protein
MFIDKINIILSVNCLHFKMKAIFDNKLKLVWTLESSKHFFKITGEKIGYLVGITLKYIR